MGFAGQGVFHLVKFLLEKIAIVVVIGASIAISEGETALDRVCENAVEGGPLLGLHWRERKTQP